MPPADRLGMPALTVEQQQLRAEFNIKNAPARLALAMAIGKGIIQVENPVDRRWIHQGQVLDVEKAAALTLADFDDPLMTETSTALMAPMLPVSIPLRLTGMRQVPFLTRFYEEAGPVQATQVDESKAVPVVRGVWDARVLERSKWGAISVVTNELLESGAPGPLAAVTDSLARAFAIAENYAFVSPSVVGSVLYGHDIPAPAAALLQRRHRLEGAARDLDDGAAARAVFVMTPTTAAFLATLRGTGGAPAYPTITAAGGTLLGLPVLTTDACQLDDSPVSNVVGVIDPVHIFWNAGGQTLVVSQNATLEMGDAGDLPDSPTGATDTPTAATKYVTSMFQESARRSRSCAQAAGSPAAAAARTTAATTERSARWTITPNVDAGDELESGREDEYGTATEGYVVTMVWMLRQAIGKVMKEVKDRQAARIAALETQVTERDHQLQRHAEHLHGVCRLAARASRRASSSWSAK